jgi:hypothetical protein
MRRLLTQVAALQTRRIVRDNNGLASPGNRLSESALLRFISLMMGAATMRPYGVVLTITQVETRFYYVINMQHLSDEP